MMKRDQNFFFISGISFCAALSMTLQDWLGLEGYIELLRNHWIILPWWVGACLAVLILLSVINHSRFLSKRKLPNNRSKKLKQIAKEIE